ncbi:MAG: hypothetical protein A2Y33_14410 [Spirochaetes bacterium GWF1_51_8]|nr:MAG: hypothetical protein A2Y33_14410 [Spirochaetes bacterium GWF1_51_8]
MKSKNVFSHIGRFGVLLSAFFVTALSPVPPQRTVVINQNYPNNPGKIWIQGDTLFVNDRYTGVHIYDIADPSAPVHTGFILISNNIDIAVLGDTLYADSYGNLLVYDISTLSNIRLMKTISNAVTFNYDYFFGVWYDEFGMPLYYDDYYGGGFGCMCMSAPSAMPSYSADGGGSSGQGGSTARFAVYNNQYLYTLKDGSVIKGYNITVTTNPVAISSGAYIPNSDAETLFPYEHYLFVGASTGVYIYSLLDPDNPAYVSQMLHVRAMDPVVVQSNIAYVTLRNAMEYPWNRFEIIDLGDFTNMTVLSAVPMNYPYGLTVRGKYVYICDSYNGIEICDISNPSEVSRINFYPGFATYDAIAYGDLLIITGNEVRIYSLTNTNSAIPEYLSALH